MLGSDPELFLKQGDKYISAIGLIGGTKNHPRPIKELGKGFCVQEDNVLLEFNTPPAKRPSQWVDNHTKMLDYLNKTLKEKGLDIAIDASADMPMDQLEDPRALVFGCDPDFNVWSLRPNPRPYSENLALRVAGGHVHVAYKGSDTEKIRIGRALDAFLGLWSVINDPDTRRRQLYGKAGAIRFKPYGLEYRTLSNFWLKTPALINEVWERAFIAVDYPKEIPEEVEGIINSGDKDHAKDMLDLLYGYRKRSLVRKLYTDVPSFNSEFTALLDSIQGTVPTNAAVEIAEAFDEEVMQDVDPPEEQ